MATIATVNTSDKTLILATRQGFLRQLSIGTSWTKVRIGMFYTVVPSGNDDAACTSEALPVATENDRFTFGLKDSSAIVPAFSGSRFIGVQESSDVGGTSNLTTNNAQQGNIRGDFSAHSLRPCTYNGTTRLSNSDPNILVPIFPAFNVVSVNGFIGFDFQVSNFGTASQTVGISYLGTTSHSDVSENALKIALRSVYASYGVNFTWNAAGAALPLPDYFWVRLPFNNNRIRITSYGSLRIS